MKKVFMIFVLSVLANSLHAQTISRWKSNSKEIKSKSLAYQVHSDIFKDYGWTMPDVKSQEISMAAGGYSFDNNGHHYTVTKNSETEISVSQDIKPASTFKIQKSKNDIYYDKRLLKYKAVTKHRWVSHTYYMYTSVPVTHTRNVTSYQYDSYSKTSRPVYSTQSYTTYESRSTPYSRSSWEAYTEYELDIPKYNHFTISMNDSNNIVIYENAGHYFIQNISYLAAKDEDNINYVLSDNNANGIFTDAEDEILINTWNPYLKSSTYKSSALGRENVWQSIGHMESEEFLHIGIENANLVIDNKNNEYINIRKKGRVYFTNPPRHTIATINGKAYRINDRKRGYKIEYGTFNLKIPKQGFLDFDTVFTVNEKNEKITISYKDTKQSGTIAIKNLFSQNYYVTVTNGDNYSKTYHNMNKVTLPEGKNNIEIFTNGTSIPFTMDVKAGDNIDYDFEAELKKMTTEIKDGKDGIDNKEGKKDNDKK